MKGDWVIYFKIKPSNSTYICTFLLSVTASDKVNMRFLGLLGMCTQRCRYNCFEFLNMESGHV